MNKIIKKSLAVRLYKDLPKRKKTSLSRQKFQYIFSNAAMSDSKFLNGAL